MPTPLSRSRPYYYPGLDKAASRLLPGQLLEAFVEQALLWVTPEIINCSKDGKK